MYTYDSFVGCLPAAGCSNLVPPSDAWLRRTDNEATIGCYTTRQRWNLRCDGNHWKGIVGVCSGEGALNFKQIWCPQRDAKSTE